MGQRINSAHRAMRCWALCGGLAVTAWSSAQYPVGTEWYGEDRVWSAAKDAFEKEKFGLATALYGQWEAETDLPADHTRRIEADYHQALCALYLYHKDAGEQIAAFANAHPDHPLAKQAQWDHANNLYQEKDWADAVAVYNILSERRLGRKQLDELRFKRGHSLFEMEAYDEAKADLFAVQGNEGDYADAAKYYFSHIAYVQGKPAVALQGFRDLAEKEDFEDLVPIYITQLLHETERFDELIAYAPALLSEDSPLNISEQDDVARLLGDAYYRKQRYAEARPLLEQAWKATRGPQRTRPFAYQMGFIRHEGGDEREALNAFALVTREADDLAQNALYHMADCYVKLGEKDKARTAFRKASELSFDIDIREDALFNHAKLAFELSYNPFDDAITAFERYLEEFPDSKRSDEAYGFLLEVYLTSKDYERALAALDRIKDKNIEVRRAWQLVSYNLGVELFRADKFDAAEPHFEQVRTYPIDAILTAESHFWQGELNYRLKRFPTASAHYGAFIEHPGAYNSSYYAQGEYARGYALFKRKKYVDALSAFRSFLKVDNGEDVRRTRDAKLRTGDCFFANKSFGQAAEAYTAVLTEEATDYAQFQLALCRSYLDDRRGAIAAFDALIARHPSSSLVPEARYEAARRLIEEGDLAPAKDHLNTLLSEHPNSPKTKYALVDLCLIGIKQGEDEEVLVLWDRIRNEYGTDPIAGDAYNVVEPLLIDRGLLDGLPSGVGLDGDEIEERLYTAARSLALARDCDKAVVRLGEYIRSYDSGQFLTEAHFFLGNCAYDLGRNAEAREAFEYVLAQPTNDYTEQAALGAATMAWNASDLSIARNHYATLEAVSVQTENLLEARIGLMRCHYLLNEPDPAKVYADQVLADDRTPDDIRRTALFWRGKILFDREDWSEAYADLAKVASYGGARGAESKYLMCEIAFKREKFEAAEQEIFQLVDAFTAYDKWKIKSFVLLVKVYIGLGDLFQARATAESILANVDQPEIVGETEDLLQVIGQLETENLTPSDTLQMTAPIPGNNLDTLNQANPTQP